MMAVILNCAIGFSHFAQKRTLLLHSDSTWWWQPSWILPCWIQTLPSWIQTPCHLLSDSHKSTLTPLWLWLKLIESWLKLIHSHCNLMMAAILKSANLNLAILDSAILSFFSQTHSHLTRLVPNFCTKNFTHSFWLNLMIAAILNSAMLDSDTAILDSNTLLSSLRFTQKQSHSTLTLTQTHSFSPILMTGNHLVFSSWIQPFCTKLWITSSIWSNSFILTSWNGYHLEFWPSWIQTLPTWIQISCYLFSNSFKTLSLKIGSGSN